MVKRYTLLITEQSGLGKAKKASINSILVIILSALILLPLVLLPIMVTKNLAVFSDIKSMRERKGLIKIEEEIAVYNNQINSALDSIKQVDIFIKEVFNEPHLLNNIERSLVPQNLVAHSSLVNSIKDSDKDSYLFLTQLAQHQKTIQTELAKRENVLKLLDRTLKENQVMLSHRPDIWPVTTRISSGFGFRQSPFTGEISFHEGTDIPASTGTPVYATADGVVVFAGVRSGYGYLVSIDHGFGFMTRYGHNSKLIAKSGDIVKKGDVIALVGSTGRSLAPHTHYEVLYNGSPVNSAKFLINKSTF